MALLSLYYPPFPMLFHDISIFNLKKVSTFMS